MQNQGFNAHQKHYYVKPFTTAVQLVMHLKFSVAAVQCLYQSNLKNSIQISLPNYG